MKALSIRQPWVWAILHAGKDIENRDWQDANPNLRFRGPFLLHASGGITRTEYADCLGTLHQISLTHPFPSGLTLPAFEKLDRGGIVGAARVVDIVTEHPSPWFFGSRGLVLADVRACPLVPCKGALGFFDVPQEVIDKLPRTKPLQKAG